MTAVSDLADNIIDYPNTGMNLSIVDRVVQPPGVGPAVNINEIWAFQVRIDNHGYLNLTELQLHITGENGTLVATGPNGPWQTGFYFGSMTVNSGSVVDTVNLYFKAPPTTRAANTQLVDCHVNDYKVNFDRLFNNLGTHHETPAATYAAQVHPN